MPLVYKVFLEKRAEREIKKLPAEIFYRIIYEIDEQEKAVKVMRIRHRKEVYK
jgi:mRNA-degrading endonuclease RelE of RelBE toxin-antitoxin system